MKCHFVYYEDAGNVLIPGCWGTVHSNDIRDCYCRNEVIPRQFEKQIFNDQMKEKLKEIKELEKEVARLRRILKRKGGFR